MNIPIIQPNGYPGSIEFNYLISPYNLEQFNINQLDIEDVIYPIPKVIEPEIIRKPFYDENVPTKSLPDIVYPKEISPKQIIRNGMIELPVGSTIIKETKMLVPQQISTVPYSTLAYKHDIEHNKNDILAQIELSKLAKGKTSLKNNSYKLDELKEFGKKLGININQNKDPLIDTIREMKLAYIGQ